MCCTHTSVCTHSCVYTSLLFRETVGTAIEMAQDRRVVYRCLHRTGRVVVCRLPHWGGPRESRSDPERGGTVEVPSTVLLVGGATCSFPGSSIRCTSLGVRTSLGGAPVGRTHHTRRRDLSICHEDCDLRCFGSRYSSRVYKGPDVQSSTQVVWPGVHLLRGPAHHCWVPVLVSVGRNRYRGRGRGWRF